MAALRGPDGSAVEQARFAFEFGLVFGKSPKLLRPALADALEDAANELSGPPAWK